MLDLLPIRSLVRSDSTNLLFCSPSACHCFRSDGGDDYDRRAAFICWPSCGSSWWLWQCRCYYQAASEEPCWASGRFNQSSQPVETAMGSTSASGGNDNDSRGRGRSNRQQRPSHHRVELLASRPRAHMRGTLVVVGGGGQSNRQTYGTRAAVVPARCYSPQPIWLSHPLAQPLTSVQITLLSQQAARST